MLNPQLFLFLSFANEKSEVLKRREFILESVFFLLSTFFCCMIFEFNIILGQNKKILINIITKPMPKLPPI